MQRDFACRPRHAWMLCLVLALACRASAQVANGTIVGAIADQTGQALRGAAVRIENPERAIARSVETDDRGGFRVSDLPPATYTVTATASKAPVNVVGRLSSDSSIVVSGPFLEKSTVITDQVLVEVAKSKGPDHLALIANRSCVSEPVTDARSVADAARSIFDADVQRPPAALDWSGLYFRTRRWICSRSDKRFPLLRCGRVGRCLEDSQRGHHLDTGL